eukprot:2130322-Amphidinium_carterae.1
MQLKTSPRKSFHATWMWHLEISTAPTCRTPAGTGRSAPVVCKGSQASTQAVETPQSGKEAAKGQASDKQTSKGTPPANAARLDQAVSVTPVLPCGSDPQYGHRRPFIRIDAVQSRKGETCSLNCSAGHACSHRGVIELSNQHLVCEDKRTHKLK